MPPARLLLIIDDDLLCREVFTAVAEEAGFQTFAFAGGEAALAHLALHRDQPASALLIDMQMPGLHGNALAERLRQVAGPATVLVAMSGSPVAQPALVAFDRFLLKPFTLATFLEAVEAAPSPTGPPFATLDPATRNPATPEPATPVPVILSESTYQSLAGAMEIAPLSDLYTLCLDDADRRIHLLRTAALAGDDDAFRRGAHSIKGGCGMVGALEMAALAATLEDQGPPSIDDLGALDEMVTCFLAASTRLRSMLETRLRASRAYEIHPARPLEKSL